MNKANRPFDWGNILFLTLSPIAALILGVLYVHRNGIQTADMLMFVAMFFATGLSITGGYHRYFAHASYKANPALRLFYLVFGACAFENSAMHWASDHRMHHRYTDTDKDPYNAGQGFWYSHIGWIFFKTERDSDFSNVADLQRDPLVRWQNRYHVLIAFIVGFGLPLLIGFAIGRPGGMLLWGGLIRVVFVHHVTFFINSLAHMWGRQPYGRGDSSRDSWWLALLTNGEGYHNFHHKFPSDYRNGLHWYQWDPTKWLIGGLNAIGVTYKLHRIPPQIILRARMEVEAMDAEKRIQTLPHAMVSPMQLRLEAARQHFEHALTQWGEHKAAYLAQKKAAWHDSAVRLQWKQKRREYELKMTQARQQWREALQGLSQVPLSDL
jgi:stearoyl-CoA desaturase (Delta-9 desaturase)